MMKTKPASRSLLLAATALLLVLAIAVVIRIFTPAPATVNGLRLVTGLAQYARDLRLRGMPVPPTVTLDTLLQLGYVSAEDVKSFGAAKVTFYADATDSMPQSILMEADMPDGTIQAVLADGSVQQFSASRWQELRRSLETNRPAIPPPAQPTNQAPVPLTNPTLLLQTNR